MNNQPRNNNGIHFHPPEPSAMHMKFDKALLKAVRKHHLKMAQLTEKQVCEVFRQAILSGDIQKVVVAGNGAQNVIYVPFAREQELTARVMRLQAVLEQHGIPMPEWGSDAASHET